MIWSYFCVLVLIDITRSADFLSKFHQNEYKLKDEFVQLDWYDKTYINFMSVKTFKYNRTRAATNVTFNSKIDVDKSVELLVQIYKFASNEYREFPVHFEVSVEKALTFDIVGITKIFDCGNFSLSNFEILKDTTYSICNFYVNDRKYPPLIPVGKYNTTVQIIFLERFLAQVSGFGEIYVPIKVPSKRT